MSRRMRKRPYSNKLKLWCVRKLEKGTYSLNFLSRLRNIPKSTLYLWYSQYQKVGERFLELKSPGRPSKQVNPAFEELVVELWKTYKVSAPKLHRLLEIEGFGVSERQIQKIFNNHQLRMSDRSRPFQVKFVKYERAHKNELWHTDWTVCPHTDRQLIAFIDDHSRFVVHAEYFSNATAENTILALANAIAKWGVPAEILTDNGTQFTAARNRGGGTTLFEQFCDQKGIKHILGRVHHPQTNGKVERWFGTYKQEFDERFNNLDEYVKFYNEKRIHQGIDYLVPAQRYIDDFRRSSILT